PDLDFWPFSPRPAVLPRPDPGPLPIRFFLCTEPFAGFRLLRLNAMMFYLFFELCTLIFAPESRCYMRQAQRTKYKVHPILQCAADAGFWLPPPASSPCPDVQRSDSASSDQDCGPSVYEFSGWQ